MALVRSGLNSACCKHQEVTGGSTRDRLATRIPSLTVTGRKSDISSMCPANVETSSNANRSNQIGNISPTEPRCLFNGIAIAVELAKGNRLRSPDFLQQRIARGSSLMKSWTKEWPRNLYTEGLTEAGEDKTVSTHEGSQTAFAELYKIYSRRLYRTIVSITKCPEDAEDALQETFLRVHRAIHTFEGRSSVYSWLTRIAINSALMTLRKRRSRLEILFDPCPAAQADTFGFELEDSAPSPERLCDMSQRWVRFLQALGRLDERLAGPIRMQIVKGASVKEISRTLSLTEVTVKVRLHRARRRLSTVYRSADTKRVETRRGLSCSPSPENERDLAKSCAPAHLDGSHPQVSA